MFGDEASFWLDGSLHRTWARVGVQPHVDTYGLRKTAHVFGALSLEPQPRFDDRFASVFNGDTFLRCVDSAHELLGDSIRVQPLKRQPDLLVGTVRLPCRWPLVGRRGRGRIMRCSEWEVSACHIEVIGSTGRRLRYPPGTVLTS